jgi:hypothetical protein
LAWSLLNTKDKIMELINLSNTFQIKPVEGKASEKSAQPEGTFKKILDEQSLDQARGKTPEKGTPSEKVSKGILDRPNLHRAGVKVSEKPAQPERVSEEGSDKESPGQGEIKASVKNGQPEEVSKEAPDKQSFDQSEESSRESLPSVAIVNIVQLLSDPENILLANPLNGKPGQQESGFSVPSDITKFDVGAPPQPLLNPENILLVNPLNGKPGRQESGFSVPSVITKFDVGAPPHPLLNTENILPVNALVSTSGEQGSEASVLSDAAESPVPAPAQQPLNPETMIAGNILDEALAKQGPAGSVLSDAAASPMPVPPQQPLNPENILLNMSDANPRQGLTTAESAPQGTRPDIFASLQPGWSDHEGTSGLNGESTKGNELLGPPSEKSPANPLLNGSVSFTAEKVPPIIQETRMNWDPKIDEKSQSGPMKNTFFDEAPLLFDENGKIRLLSDPSSAGRGVYHLVSELKGMEGIAIEKHGSAGMSDGKGSSPDGSFVFLNQSDHQKIIPGLAGEVKNVEEPLPTKTVHGDIYQQVGEKVIWGIRNNEDKIKFALNPPELGNIYVEIDRNKENIKAVLWAEQPITKEMLQAHETELHRILKADGFNLEKFDVFARQDMGWFQEPKENHVKHDQWSQGDSFRQTGSLLQGRSEVSPVAIQKSPGGDRSIDVFV